MLVFNHNLFFFLSTSQSDSVSYFLDDLDRISRLDYVPTHRDILHCRKATKGVFEFTIRIQVIKKSFYSAACAVGKSIPSCH